MKLGDYHFITHINSFNHYLKTRPPSDLDSPWVSASDLRSGEVERDTSVGAGV